MRLVITARPLNGRWSITSSRRLDCATWPPSPDTLFSALVAAAASLGSPCHPALAWLEKQGNPAIEATEAPPNVQGIATFDPVADVPIWGESARKQRWHNSIGDASPVSWSWAITTTEHLTALQMIAREVTYIGSSRGPVLVAASITDGRLPASALVPTEAGRRRIRGLYAGRLQDLEAAFQRGERPRPAQAVGYARNDERSFTSPWGQLIPLRRVAGPALFLSHTVPVAEAMRRAISAHLPDAAPASLTGHQADKRMLADEHMAVVPLPRVGDQFADGELLGAGLMLPRSMSDDDYGVLMGGLGRWLHAGGRVGVNGFQWQMAIAANDHRRSLRENRFDGVAKVWTSVTPVAFDRHPRRGLTSLDVVGRMCRAVGLPEPAHVQNVSSALLDGAQQSRSHHLGGRAYLRKNPIAHLRITWDTAVPGPILLGRGRYFGLGVMLPERTVA
jgi:CRISPR-associated protein Csb2